MLAGVGIDQSVLDWFVAHRVSWLSPVIEVVTVLGSSVFLIPFVVAVGVWSRRRCGTSRPFVLLGVAYGGAYAVSQALKVLVGRPRPPAGVAIGHYSGYAFPSGHATQAAAVWLMVAFVVAAAAPSSRQRMWIWIAAVSTVVVVGITRLYLAAHWLTDVVGGWVFGALWFGSILAVGVRGRIGACAPSASTPTGSPN